MKIVSIVRCDIRRSLIWFPVDFCTGKFHLHCQAPVRCVISIYHDRRAKRTAVSRAFNGKSAAMPVCII